MPALLRCVCTARHHTTANRVSLRRELEPANKGRPDVVAFPRRAHDTCRRMRRRRQQDVTSVMRVGDSKDVGQGLLILPRDANDLIMKDREDTTHVI